MCTMIRCNYLVLACVFLGGFGSVAPLLKFFAPAIYVIAGNLVQQFSFGSL